MLVFVGNANGSTGSTGQVLLSDGTSPYWGDAPGGGGISSLVEDTSPQLGGTLDANNNSIHLTPGSVTTPALAFATDQNTGLYRVTTDTLGITTGGIEAMRFAEAGSVITLTTNGQMQVPNGTVEPRGSSC